MAEHAHHVHKPNKHQQKVILIGGGLVLLYLLYRWYSAKAAANSATTASGTTATDAAGADYAALAGQEQGDVAALQQQNQALAAQEQSDFTGLQGLIAAINGQIAQIESQIQGLGSGGGGGSGGSGGGGSGPGTGPGASAPGSTSTASTGMGHSKTTRTHKPPKGPNLPKPKQPAHNHAGARNQHIKHPNAKHEPKTGAHRTVWGVTPKTSLGKAVHGTRPSKSSTPLLGKSKAVPPPNSPYTGHPRNDNPKPGGFKIQPPMKGKVPTIRPPKKVKH